MVKETPKEFADRQNREAKARAKRREEEQARKIREEREAKRHV